MKAEENPVVLFTTPDGDVRVNAVLRDRTLWLTQKSDGGVVWSQEPGHNKAFEAYLCDK